MKISNIDTKTFILALKSAMVVVPKSDVRYYLKGVYVRCNDHGVVDIVATDGHRLVWHRLTADYTEAGQAILDRDSVEAYLKANKTPKGDSTRYLQLIGDKAELTGADAMPWLFALVEGRYPDFERIIPQNWRERAQQGMVGINGKYVADSWKALESFTDRFGGLAFYLAGPSDVALIEGRVADLEAAHMHDQSIYAVMPLRLA